MKIIAVSTRRSVGACLTFAVLTACGGLTQQSVVPSAPSSMRQTTMRPSFQHSWMSPHAKSEDLIYVSNENNNTVTVYGLWTHKLLGMLTGISQPYGVCSDNAGNVWVIGWGNNKILKYAHAATAPAKVLTLPPEDDPYDCSVDPTTGDLAITNWGFGWYEGNVLVFARGAGKPKAYMGPGLWFYYSCAYDDSGNLFVDGWDAYLNGYFALGEMYKGTGFIKNIVLRPNLDTTTLGAVRWDGRYVVVGYRYWVNEYRISGPNAYQAGTTLLTFNQPVGFFWITRSNKPKIMAPDQAGSPDAVQYWDYPTGDSPTATIKQALKGTFGVTVSMAVRR